MVNSYWAAESVVSVTRDRPEAGLGEAHGQVTAVRVRPAGVGQDHHAPPGQLDGLGPVGEEGLPSAAISSLCWWEATSPCTGGAGGLLSVEWHMGPACLGIPALSRYAQGHDRRPPRAGPHRAALGVSAGVAVPDARPQRRRAGPPVRRGHRGSCRYAASSSASCGPAGWSRNVPMASSGSGIPWPGNWHCGTRRSRASGWADSAIPANLRPCARIGVPVFRVGPSHRRSR